MSSVYRFVNVNLSCLVSVLLPLAMLTYWHTNNFVYPYSDEGTYFEHSQRIQLKFESLGIIEALRSAYLDRSYKGTFQSVLAAPALILLGGDVLAAHALTCAVLFGLLLVYFFLLLRNYLSPWRSALGTLVYGFSAGAINNAHTFNAELPMTLALIACGYHLLKGSANIAALWFGVGLAMKPVELLLISFIPLIWIIGKGLREMRIQKRDLLVLLTYLVTFGLYCVWAVRNEYSPVMMKSARFQDFIFPLFLISAPGFLFLIAQKGLGLYPSFNRPLAISYLISTSLILPYAAAIYKWAYTASFAQHTVVTGGRIGVSYFGFLSTVASSILGYPFLILLTLGVLSGKHPWRGVFLIAIAGALAHPLIGGLSHNGDVRYYAASGTILYAIVLILALHPTGLLSRARLTIVLALLIPLVLYSTLVVRSVTSNTLEDRQRNQDFLRSLTFFKTKWSRNPEYPFRGTDPSRHIVTRLRALFPERSNLRVAVVRTPFTSVFEYQLNGHSIRLTAREFGLDLDIFQSELGQSPQMIAREKPDAIVEVFERPKIIPPFVSAPDLSAATRLSGYTPLGWFYLYDYRVLSGGPAGFGVVHGKTNYFD